MRNVPLWDSGRNVATKFVVVMSAYPGEYLIYIDHEPSEHDDAVGERLANLKAFIRSERRDVERRKVQRYTADEVATFLKASCEIV